MRLTLRRRQILWAYLFLSVTLIFFVVIRWYPTFFALNISFRNWQVMQGTGPWVGLQNYMEIIEDFGKRRSDVRAAFLNTGKYVLLGVPAQIAIGLIVALLLNSIRRFTGFFRAAYFIPFVTSLVAVAFVWNWLYAPLTGLINQMLRFIGLPPQLFLGSPTQALPAITAVAVWAAVGFTIIIFLAGLQQIPDIYYEAAEIDGATAWQKFWKITIPLLNPVIVYLTVLATISFLREFVLVRNMSPRGEGGPLNSTISVVLHVYQTGFGSYRMGYAAAVTVVLFLIILAITILQLRFLSRRVEY